ncbi:MAG: hypothetical protein SO161_12665 [Treponema sp.]|nr:hypothetical protein [Treponema sp.]
MITFEDILPHLCELFIEKLPLYIEEINKIHNDGLTIYPFENKTLFENCQKLPCFKFELLEAEYSEKDRIIENTVFDFSFEITIKTETNKKIIEIYRYIKIINKLIKENQTDFQQFYIKKITNNKIFLRVIP